MWTKRSNKESVLVEAARKAYYVILDKISENGHIRQYKGFGLYDSPFIRMLSSIEDPMPYLRGIVAELAPNVGIVSYDHELRKKGKSKFSFYKLLDYSLFGLISTSKIAMCLVYNRNIYGGILLYYCYSNFYNEAGTLG